MTATPPEQAELLAKLYTDTRIPPAELVHKKGQFDYVGHADTTALLLEHDPCWTWEPFALDDNGLPKVMYDAGAKPRAMWIRLTIHGVTRIGVGTCSATAGDPYKELIGDAIRNAAMRFGIALTLWSLSEWSDEGPAAQTTTPAATRPRAPKKEPVLAKDQAMAAHAQELGIDDQTRRDIILAITKGRTASGKDLEPAEVIWVATAIEDVASGAVELRYDPNGTPRLGKARQPAGNNPGPT